MIFSGPGKERNAFIAFVVALVVATVAFIVLLGPDDPERAIDDARPRIEESSEAPTTDARDRETSPRKRREEQQVDLTGLSRPGLGTQPGGLQGGSANGSLKKHTMTVRLTSTAPIGYVAYIIPTSSKHEKGEQVVSGSSWTLTTTVYGPPDYGAIFTQGGYNGRQVHCEVTVDGKVTERRSTQGPYGTIWCQG